MSEQLMMLVRGFSTTSRASCGRPPAAVSAARCRGRVPTTVVRLTAGPSGRGGVVPM